MTNCESELNNDVAYPTRLNGRASQSKVLPRYRSIYDIYLRCIGSCSAQKAVKNIFKGFWISHVGIIIMKGMSLQQVISQS